MSAGKYFGPGFETSNRMLALPHARDMARTAAGLWKGFRVTPSLPEALRFHYAQDVKAGTISQAFMELLIEQIEAVLAGEEKPVGLTLPRVVWIHPNGYMRTVIHEDEDAEASVTVETRGLDCMGGEIWEITRFPDQVQRALDQTILHLAGVEVAEVGAK